MRFLFTVVLVGVSFAAIAALMGFAVPLLDALNHLQLALVAITLTGLLLIPLVIRGAAVRAFLLALAGTGFLASAIIVVPEAVSIYLPRPPYPLDSTPVYRLMSHNLFGRNYEMTRAATAIFAEDPDIVALQEYFPPQISGLHELLAERYPYSVRCAGGKRASIAIYAKQSFESIDDGSCAEAEAGRKRTARIAARFTGLDGAVFTVVTSHQDWPVQVSPLWDKNLELIERAGAMTARQQGQFAELGEALSALPGPLILAGDLNSTPWSFALRQFASEAGLERQTRSFLSYPTRFYLFGAWRTTLPVLPLDHVLSREGLAVHAVRRGDPGGSDHVPVIIDFSVGPGETTN